MDSFIDKFLSFEEKNNLVAQEIGGFHFWAYSRFDIYIELFRRNSGHAEESYPHENTVKSFLSILANLTFNNPLLHADNKEIAIFTHARRVFIDEKYECIYTDKIAEEFGGRAIQCEYLYRGMHLTPAYSRILLPLDYVDIWSGIRCRLNPKMYPETQAELQKKVVEIRKLIKNAFGEDLGEVFLYNRFVRAYPRYRMKKKLLGKLLDRINPKVIVEVVGYTFNNMILNELAKERKIISIEFQHGVIGQGHIAYNYLSNREFDYMPQKMFFFSDYWIETCRFPLSASDKYAAGYPYAEAQINRYPKALSTPDKIRIIVLSQPEIDEMLVDLVDKLLRNKRIADCEFSIIYKLHPHSYENDKTIYANLTSDERFTLIDNSKTPLYKLFAESDVQIGTTSTAIFEGLSYDLKTLIYHVAGTDVYMGDLCRLGYAQMFEDDKDLILKLQQIAKNSGEAGTKKVFFESNAKQRMFDQIEALLNTYDC